MDRQTELGARVGVFLGSLRTYDLTSRVSRLNRGDPALESAQKEIYALADAGFDRGSVIDLVIEHVDSRQDQEPYNKPKFRGIAQAAVCDAYRRAKMESIKLWRTPKPDVIPRQAERVGDGLFEYATRIREDDPSFDDLARQDLEYNITGAVGVMTKHGLTEVQIMGEIKDYLGEDWVIVDKKLATRLVREGIEDRTEAEIRSA